MYLLDTNVWLERLLAQERNEEVKLFLQKIPSEQLFITDFSFHSIGVILLRLGSGEAYLRFSRDAFVDGSVHLVHLYPEDIPGLLSSGEKFNLDFDDAYQYMAAEKYNLTLLSFDSDFDGTERGRKTPAEILGDT